MQTYISSQIDDILTERKATMAANKKQFAQMKTVCAEFFQRYDVSLEEVKIGVDN